MANENTPINAGQDASKQGAGSQPSPQPVGDPKPGTEQKTAPGLPDRSEPARK
jgi:hypothetical protein